MKFIFLPGASGRTAFWHPVRTKICSTANSEILFYPSFGGSPSLAKVQNFADLETFIIDQIHSPCILIAQSMGGIFAVQAALKKPQQVKALVLVASSGGIDLSPFQVADWREDYQLSFDVPDWFVTNKTKLDDQLDKIDCPVLLIWGNADPISPVAVGQYLKTRFKQATLIVIEQGQHDLAEKHAVQVAMHIQHFLKNMHLDE